MFLGDKHMDEQFVSIGKAAKMIGMSIEGLRHWEAAGVLVPMRTLTNQRRYRVADLQALLPEMPAIGQAARCILYARVSKKNNKRPGIWIGNSGVLPHLRQNNNGRWSPP